MPDVVAWHKSIAKAIADGGFGATTFNLAFFLHNLFRDDGRTVSQYLKVARLERARELLQRRHAPDVSVTDVALACGYSNMSQFSTAFRRAFGLTPRDVLMGR